MSLQAAESTEATQPTGLAPGSDSVEFVTVTIAGQLLGIPILSVEDVLGPQKISQIPKADPAVAGVLNLRGRIVTAIDVRRRLGLPPIESNSTLMSVVVEHDREPYSLLIDAVGDVLKVPVSSYERNPATLDPRWAQVSAGIYRLDDKLLVALEVGALLDFDAV